MRHFHSFHVDLGDTIVSVCMMNLRTEAEVTHILIYNLDFTYFRSLFRSNTYILAYIFSEKNNLNG